MSSLTGGLLASGSTIITALMMIWGLGEEIQSFGEPEIIGQTIVNGIVVETIYAEPAVSAGMDIALIIGGVIVTVAMIVGGGIVAWHAFVREELTWRARIAGFYMLASPRQLVC